MLTIKSVMVLPMLLITALSSSSVLGATTLICPEKIDATSTLASAPSGWSISTDRQPNPFSRISVTSGPPDEEAFLVPDADSRTQATWLVPAQQQYWVVCHYLNSSVCLAQKIPANVHQCTLHTKPVGGKATQQDNKLVCQ